MHVCMCKYLNYFLAINQFKEEINSHLSIVQAIRMCAHINEGEGSFPLPTFTQLSVRVGMSLMVRCMIPVQLLAMFLKPWTEI